MPAVPPTSLRKLLLASILSACIPAALAASQPHMQSAERFIAAGDLPAAIIELKNAIQAEPEDAAGQYLPQAREG